MREYMVSLGCVLMIIAFSKMILPEGSIKKYVSLATGFILISTALTLFPGKIGEISFDEESFRLDEGDIAKMEATYQAKVITEHRENLQKKIEEQMSHNSKAFVEVSPEGEILSVTLRLQGDESKAVKYIVEELGVERERIKIKNDET